MIFHTVTSLTSSLTRKSFNKIFMSDGTMCRRIKRSYVLLSSLHRWVGLSDSAENLAVQGEDE